MDAFSEDECRLALEELRWPDGVRCPRCDCDQISRIYGRGQLDCNSCRFRFSVKVGTVMHDSHLPLRKWFVATFLMCESKKGISSLQLQRTLGVAYRTAWYLTHRIRAAMAAGEKSVLSRIVEVNRDNPYLFRDTLRSLVRSEQLTPFERGLGWPIQRNTHAGHCFQVNPGYIASGVQVDPTLITLDKLAPAR